MAWPFQSNLRTEVEETGRYELKMPEIRIKRTSTRSYTKTDEYHKTMTVVEVYEEHFNLFVSLFGRRWYRWPPSVTQQ